MISWFKRYLRHDLLPLLADLKLAIGLLLTIAVASALGTVIEQGQMAAFYQANYPEDPALFGFLSWRVILALGLDHVYKTSWFLSILILFGTSLTACTFTRQWPIFKVARRWSYYTKPRSFYKLALSNFTPHQDLHDLPEILRQRRYHVFQEGATLYARKGLIGKIGPIVVHASMLLILIGAIWGSVTGFTAQAMIPSGSTSSITRVFQAGEWAADQIPSWQIQVNNFWIDYSPQGRVKQFYSDLSIMDRGQEVKRETIHVNQPLTYDGVTLYQADWTIDAVRARVNNSPSFRLPVKSLKSESGGDLWGTFVPTKPDFSAGVTVLIPDLQGTVLVYGEQGELIGSVRSGSSLDISDQLTLYIDQVIGATGLQIKSDPGIPLVYAGFGLLMLGVIMSYVSHSQIWALDTEEGLYLGGKTNRALVTFEREFFQILDTLDSPPRSQDPQSTADPTQEPLITSA